MEKACNKCGEVKGFEHFYKNKQLKDGHFNVCKPCFKMQSDSWYAQNKDRKQATSKAWKRDNAETYKQWSAQYYQDNKEKYDQINNDWWKRNPEKKKSKDLRWDRANRYKRLAASLLYQKINAGRLNAKRAKRKALKLNATPAWANGKAIDQYYLIAKFLSDELGVRFHVDHIVPLQSDVVCGLHSHTNLTIAVGSWNCSKSNRWWPHMP
ncbi:hypothetical protein [Paraburkholderia tropica]|uniref:hypothetical protein n=1 Tax=Paraburkholderia tropica TaxID=92647 RepID=UPI003D2A2D93